MYERILVPIDGSPTSELGLQEAVRLAKLTGARLRLLHVTDVLSLAIAGEAYGGPAGDLLSETRKEGEALLRRAKAAVEAQGVAADVVIFDNASGRVAELVVDDAMKSRADLIVVGTHGRRGVGRLMLGSDAEQIVRSAPVPVLLVRDKAGSKP
jgi:nucleotide-binding universal stress UspA family protein